MDNDGIFMMLWECHLPHQKYWGIGFRDLEIETLQFRKAEECSRTRRGLYYM